MKLSEPARRIVYYQLRCATCDELFPPLCTTTPDELLRPDYDECAEQAGELNAERLREFHRTHQGHELETVEA